MAWNVVVVKQETKQWKKKKKQEATPSILFVTNSYMELHHLQCKRLCNGCYKASPTPVIDCLHVFQVGLPSLQCGLQQIHSFMHSFIHICSSKYPSNSISHLLSNNSHPNCFYFQVPEGYIFSTILVAGQNITGTMRRFGEIMRTFHQKDNSYRRTDFTINYLG